MPLPYRYYIKQRGMSKFIDVSKFEKIISVLPNYDSIDKLHSIGKIAENSMKFEAEQVDVLAGDKVWVDGNAKLYRNLKIYIKLFNQNNNKVQIKDVFFFNETLKDVEMGESLLLLLFLFEKGYCRECWEFKYRKVQEEKK